MVTEVGERIKVMAVFDGGVKPVKFRWRDRVYPVREVTYTWRSMDGSARIMHFSVTDGSTLFELTFNQATMRWSLESVEA
jgi:hypothetical protein